MHRSQHRSEADSTRSLIDWATRTKPRLGSRRYTCQRTRVRLRARIALPTAQNAFIAASRAHAGEEIAQGTVLITTLGSLPVVLATAAVFHLVLGL